MDIAERQAQVAKQVEALEPLRGQAMNNRSCDDVRSEAKTRGEALVERENVIRAANLRALVRQENSDTAREEYALLGDTLEWMEWMEEEYTACVARTEQRRRCYPVGSNVSLSHIRDADGILHALGGHVDWDGDLTGACSIPDKAAIPSTLPNGRYVGPHVFHPNTGAVIPVDYNNFGREVLSTDEYEWR